MAKSKKIRMPAGIRNKLMAAVSMLLVSTIMMVSTTYAWFTLSTAPEVTGITTSVGANGNLEMALLTSGKKGAGDKVEIEDTFNHLDKITSAVGDSSSAAGKTALTANITWGNLVDLSDTSYGLDTINLMPARLNATAGADGAAAKVKTEHLLQTAVYGKDGRVDKLNDQTYSSASYNSATGNWSFSNTQTYGVRAIGANDNLTPQQSGLMAAKSAYTSKLNEAKNLVSATLAANGNALAGAVAAMAMESTTDSTTGSTTLDDTQQRAISDMVNKTGKALDALDAAYKQVLKAAASQLDSDKYLLATAAIDGAGSYADAVTALTKNEGTVPGDLPSAAVKLTEQKNAVQSAKENIRDSKYKEALQKLVDPKNVLINGYKAGKAHDGDSSGEYVMDSAGNIAPDFPTKYSQAGGRLMVQMPDGSGVFAYIGSVAGNYSVACTIESFNYGSLKLSNVPVTMQTTATQDVTINNALNALKANSEAGAAETTLSDTYGYALDFAFRTNAADSKLQLQTDAAQRVYTDSTNELTQGNGSTMTFKAAQVDGKSVLEDAQVMNLMQAIRVAFIDPASGEIYGVAALTGGFESNDGSYTGKLYLQNYTIEGGQLKLNGNKMIGDKNDVALMTLQQNTAQRLTVIVWLDGDSVDNGDVANAAQSITGSLNLQFSSSATLIPMKNTALRNLTESETSTTKTLTDIEITTQPTKITYTAGEQFSADGMVVTAKYSDNSNEVVTDYTITPAEALTKDNNKVTVSYTKGDVTKTATQNITVTENSVG